jgi:zinc transport system ATP-binding protein
MVIGLWIANAVPRKKQAVADFIWQHRVDRANRRSPGTIFPVTDLVCLSNLDFAYQDQLVLKHIQLNIPAGITLGVIGPNGGGKTTLLQLMLGLLHPTRGTILIEGLTPTQATRRGDLVGYLPQRHPVPRRFPLSVRETVLLGLAGKTGLLRNYHPDEVRFVDWLLEHVGLHDLADRPVGSISGGQLQRCLIARALAPRPKLLLLDEPTTGIDRSGQQRFIEFLEDLKQSLGLTVVLVSHDLRAISAMSDRIACLNVTLHYHDVSDHLSAEAVYTRYACDVEATRLRPGGAGGAP